MAKGKPANLREIGDEIHSVEAGGKLVSNRERLDRLLWQEATGWTETTALGAKIVHPPNIQVAIKLKEQLDGRAGTAAVEEKKGLTAAETVRKLAVDRVNALANKQLT